MEEEKCLGKTEMATVLTVLNEFKSVLRWENRGYDAGKLW